MQPLIPLAPVNAPLTGVTPSDMPVENDNQGLLTNVARGLKSSLLSTSANSAATDYYRAKAEGDETRAARAGLRAQQLSEETAAAAPRVSSLGDVHGAGDAADWLAGQVGGAPAGLVEPAVGGLAGGLAGARFGPTGAAVGGALGATGAMVPGLRDAAVMQRYQAAQQGVPQAAPQEVLDSSLRQGAAQAAPFLLAPVASAPGRLVGKSVLPPTTLGKSLARGAAVQGAMGAGSEAIGQQFENDFNPNRDRSHDNTRLLDAAASNALLSLPFEAAGHVGDTTKGVVGAGADLGRKALDAVTPSVIDGAGKGADMAKALWDKRPQNAAEAAEMLGKAGAKAANAGEDALNGVLNRGRDPDVELLAKAPVDSADIPAMQADDAARHAAADNLSAKIQADPSKFPSYVQEAAASYAQGSKMMDSWRVMHDALADWKRSETIADGVQNFIHTATDQGAKFAAEVAKFAEDTKATYDYHRQNAMTPEGAEHVRNNQDEFDPLLQRALAPFTGLTSPAAIEQNVPVMAFGMRRWIENGFALKKGGKAVVPDGLLKMFQDPVKAVSTAYDLMQRQGLAPKEGPSLQDAVKVLSTKMEAAKHIGSIVEDNLTPVAQEKGRFSGADHEDIARSIQKMTLSGKYDTPRLVELFGTKEKAKFVIDALNESMEKERKASGEDLRHDIEKQDVKLQEERSMSDPVKPNEVGETVAWHPYRPENKNGPAEPYRRDGQIVDNDTGEIKGTHEAHATQRISELQAKNSSAVKRIGYMDYLREVHAGDPERLMREAVDFMERKRADIKDKGRPDDAINKMFYMLREEQASDRGEATNIHGDEFKNLTPNSKQNKWSESVGKNMEFGDVGSGKIWFERADGTKFATSATRIIKRMIDSRKTEHTNNGASGLAGQHELLLQGIASMLTAKDADGNYALSGKVGYMKDPSGRISWGQKSVPDSLRMYSDSGKTFGDAKKLASEVKSAETDLSASKSQRQEDAHDRAQPQPKGETRSDRATKEAVLRTLPVLKEGVAALITAARGLPAAERAEMVGALRKLANAVHSDGIWDVARSGTGPITVKERAKAINQIQARAVRALTFLDSAEHIGKGAERASERAGKDGDLRRSKYPPAENPESETIRMGQQAAHVTAVEEGGKEKPREFEAHTGEQVGTAQKKSSNSMPDPSARENAQDAKSAAFGPARAATDEERAAFFGDIKRRFGDTIQAELHQALTGTNGKGKKIALSGDWMPGVIRASVFAQNIGQIGAHESMHEFFNRLMNGGPGAKRVADILTKAANSAPVVRQLERLLVGHDNALAQIKEGAKNATEERLAYMFQFHQAGLLNLGPETKTVFQHIADFFRKVSGLLSNDQKADRLLRMFDEGKTPTADAAAEVLAKNIEARENLYKAVNGALAPALDRARRLVATTETSMRSAGPEYDAIRRMFKRSVGESGEQGMLDARDHQMKQKSNILAKAFTDANGHAYDKKDLEMVAPYLHSGERPKDRVAREIFDKIMGKDGLLPMMHDYLVKAGVERWEVSADGGRWVPLGKVKDNYFPRVYNTAEIVSRPGEMAKDMVDFNRKELAAIAETVNKRLDKGDAPKTVEDVAKALVNRLINGNGEGGDLGENTSAVGFTPFMRSVNQRSLTWLHPEIMKKWGEKDISKVLTSYVAQAVKRAEYVRLFGSGGHVLKEKLDAAYKANLQRMKDAAPGASKEELAKIELKALKVAKNMATDVMAMEGTLGYGINPKLRKFNNSMLVYQNLRTLSTSLFSQFIDPLGLVVNGGTMQDAWRSYVRGMREVVASIKGTHIKDLDQMIADHVGTTDANGFLAAFGQLYSSQYMGAGFRKANDMLFKLNGMEGFNRGMQVSATRTAINFIKRHVEKPDDTSERRLGELNLKAADVKIDPKTGELDYNDPKIQQAIHQWVNGSIMRPNSAQRPAWASDPHYMMFWHMKQFAYTFHDVIMKRALHQVKEYGDFGPAGVLAALYTPVMIASDTAKSLLLTGEEPAWMKMGLGSEIKHGAMRAGLAGQFQPAADVLQPGRSVAGLGGPMVEQLAQMFTQSPHDAAINALPGANLWNTIGGRAAVEVQGED